MTTGRRTGPSRRGRTGRALPWAVPALLAALAFGSACGSPRPDARSHQVEDSAGIRIVTNRGGRWDSAGGWRLSREPAVAIGAVEGPPEYLFSRVAGAVRTGDGRIVVADGGSDELRFFGPEGRYRKAVGGSGPGPGEFEHIRALRRCHPDSLYAFDIDWGLELFDARGNHVRSAALETSGTVPSPYDLACNAEGLFLLSGWGEDVLEHGVGYYRTRARLWLAPSGDSLRLVGTCRGAERLGSRGGSRPHPFGKELVFALGEDRAYVGTGDRYEIRVTDLRGDLRRLIRRTDVELDLPRSVVDRYRKRRLAQADGQARADLRTRLADEEFPSTVPAFDRIVLDPTGHLWVRAFRSPLETRSRWAVFDSAGVLLGELEMPERFRMTEIGAGHVLGVRRDELGVPTVELYDLEKP